MTNYQTAAQMTGRPYNNRVASYGDSRVANALLIAGANSNVTTCSIVGWARNLCKQSFIHDTSDVHGVGGYTSDQLLALLQTNLIPPGVEPAATLVFLISTNDQGIAGYTAAQTIANLQAIQDLALYWGRVVIWLNEMPRGGSNVLTGAMLAAHLSVVRWINQQSTVPGVYVADSWGALTDLTSASASPISGVMRGDALHPAAPGAYLAALALKPIFDLLFPPRPQVASGVADTYDATNNPRGALNANPMMTGTGGTKTAGAGTISGNLADNYTATMNSATGLTALLSKVTSGGKDWQQIVLSGTPTSAGAGIQVLANTAIHSLITAGDVIEQTLEWEIDAGQTAIQDVVNFASLNALTRRDLAGDPTNFPLLPNAAISQVSKIGPVVAAAPETGFYKPGVIINCVQNVAVAATIRVRALAARKVI